MEIEIWKDVVGFEGIYQASNTGTVKSLSRHFLRNGKYPSLLKEKILNAYPDTGGYLTVGLMQNNVKKNRTVHQIVAESFLNHIPCGLKLVVNHIDFNKQNNCVSNLEIITQRKNANLKHIKSSSKYVGVHWSNEKKKWASKITINKNVKHLGYFDNEKEASEYYENALKAIEEGKNVKSKPFCATSIHKGVCWHKSKNKWMASSYVNKKNKHLGYFNTEIEAYNAYKEFQNDTIQQHRI